MIKEKRHIYTNIALRIILLTLAASFMHAMNAGIRNNYGIMLDSIMDSSGISFASVSFVLAVGQLVFGLVQPAFGMVAAKKGNIFSLICGIILMLMGMLLTPLCKLCWLWASYFLPATVLFPMASSWGRLLLKYHPNRFQLFRGS
jgi:cyanate permease